MRRDMESQRCPQKMMPKIWADPPTAGRLPRWLSKLCGCFPSIVYQHALLTEAEAQGMVAVASVDGMGRFLVPTSKHAVAALNAPVHHV